MGRTLLTAMLAGAALWAEAALAQAPPAINLRDYWILAEIHNPETGGRASIRFDCAEQRPVECGGPRGIGPLGLDRFIFERAMFQKGRRPEEKPWPEFVRARVVPRFPGMLAFVAAGADGYAEARLAAFSELRRPGGFSARISTVRGGKKIDKTDIRLTMWLVTPDELAARDAEKAPEGAGG